MSTTVLFLAAVVGLTLGILVTVGAIGLIVVKGIKLEATNVAKLHFLPVAVGILAMIFHSMLMHIGPENVNLNWKGYFLSDIWAAICVMWIKVFATAMLEAVRLMNPRAKKRRNKKAYTGTAESVAVVRSVSTQKKHKFIWGLVMDLATWIPCTLYRFTSGWHEQSIATYLTYTYLGVIGGLAAFLFYNGVADAIDTAEAAREGGGAMYRMLYYLSVLMGMAAGVVLVGSQLIICYVPDSELVHAITMLITWPMALCITLLWLGNEFRKLRARKRTRVSDIKQVASTTWSTTAGGSSGLSSPSVVSEGKLAQPAND